MGLIFERTAFKFARFPRHKYARAVSQPGNPSMKFIAKLSAGFAAASLLVVASAEEPVKFNVPNAGSQPAQPPVPAPPQQNAPAPKAPPLAAAPAPQFTEGQMMETFGWFMGNRMGLAELEFSADSIEAIVKGLRTAAAGKQPPYELEKIGPEMDKLLQGKNQAYMQKLRQRGIAESGAFFTKLKENKNVVELPSGLRYEITQKGSGPAPALGQTVSVHYKGTLISGQMFDSSYDRGQPIEMPLQEGSAIPGWIEGLQKISKGSKARFYIPPHLAYGDEGTQGIPPGSTLIFDIELLDVKDTPKTPVASAPAAGK